MTNKNIQMKKREGNDWNNLYPISLFENIYDSNGVSLENEIKNLEDSDESIIEEVSLKSDKTYVDSKVSTINTNIDSKVSTLNTQIDLKANKTELNTLSSQVVKKNNIHSSYNYPSKIDGVEGDLWFVLARPLLDLIKLTGDPTMTLDEVTGGIDFNSTASDRAIVVSSSSLSTNSRNKLVFSFNVSNMSRTGGSVVTPVLHQSDTQPQNYVGGNLLLFRIDISTRKISVEKSGDASTAVSGITSKSTNLIEIEVVLDGSVEKAFITCVDKTDNTTLFDTSFNYADVGLSRTSNVWFIPVVDTLSTDGYRYKYNKIELVGV